MSKFGQTMVNNVLTANNSVLGDVYKRWSRNKQLAYEDCYTHYAQLDGRHFRITSANSFGFSCGFIYTYNNKWGCIACMYFTPKHTYFIDITNDYKVEKLV